MQNRSLLCNIIYFVHAYDYQSFHGLSITGTTFLRYENRKRSFKILTIYLKSVQISWKQAGKLLKFFHANYDSANLRSRRLWKENLYGYFFNRKNLFPVALAQLTEKECQQFKIFCLILDAHVYMTTHALAMKYFRELGKPRNVPTRKYSKSKSFFKEYIKHRARASRTYPLSTNPPNVYLARSPKIRS